MLAQNNEYLQEVVSGVCQLTEEEKIRQQCEARETNAYWERIREAAHKQEIQNIYSIHQQKLKDKIRYKISQGKSLEEIAEELVEEPETIRPFYDELVSSV